MATKWLGVKFTDSEIDKSCKSWLSRQTNKSLAVKFLIHKAIHELGDIDVMENLMELAFSGNVENPELFNKKKSGSARKPSGSGRQEPKSESKPAGTDKASGSEGTSEETPVKSASQERREAVQTGTAVGKDTGSVTRDLTDMLTGGGNIPASEADPHDDYGEDFYDDDGFVDPTSVFSNKGGG